MEKIKCKLCGEKHLLSEPHVFRDSPPDHLRELTKMVIEPKRCPTCGHLQRKVYATTAARQRAYRERNDTIKGS